MRLAILESPFAAADQYDLARNVAYVRAAMRECLLNGYAPIASHALYTLPGVLDDRNPHERRIGIEAGLAWGRHAEVSLIFADRGVSQGMREGIARAEAEGRPVEFRSLIMPRGRD